MLFEGAAQLAKLFRLGLEDVRKVVAARATCLHCPLNAILQLCELNRLTLTLSSHLLELCGEAQSLFREVGLSEARQALPCLTELALQLLNRLLLRRQVRILHLDLLLETIYLLLISFHVC